ncbi:serine/threonine protein kinase [Martiniozyma asiatica (nom. inval.)]|nr:serine/threonine protein kinase [Martiniozyma asiatica]
MRLLNNQYTDLGVIGRGSFGLVRKLKSKSTGKLYVRKEISYKSMSRKELHQLASEFLILQSLDHPNIVQVFDHEDIERDQMLHIYMEFCDGGDLAGLIKSYRQKKQHIPEVVVWQVLTQMLLALYRCHYGSNIEDVVDLHKSTQDILPEKKEGVVIHRDIKPDNIFFMSDGYTAKLGDFGLAKALSPNTQFTQTYVGTPYYMPPEVIKAQAYSTVCDVWSLGCVIYELCALIPPFTAKSQVELQEKIMAGKFNRIPSLYSNKLELVIEACLIPDPTARVNVNELLQEAALKVYRKEWELVQKETKLQFKEMELKRLGLSIARKETDFGLIEKKLDKKRQELDLRKVELEQNAKELDRQNKVTRELIRAEFDLVLKKCLEAAFDSVQPEYRSKLVRIAMDNRPDLGKLIRDDRRNR